MSPIDVLLIVNFLNELFEGGEGESPASLNDASFLVSHRDDLFDAVGPDRSTASKGLLASRPAERFLQPSLAAIEDRASVIPSPARRLADGPRDSDLRDAIDAFFGDFKGLSKSMLDSDS